MSKATEKVEELRQQLAEAEQVASAEQIKEREKAEKEYRLQRQFATKAFRKKLYDGSFGTNANYLAVTRTEEGMEVDVVEWTVVQTCVALTHDEMKSLRDKLTELVG